MRGDKGARDKRAKAKAKAPTQCKQRYMILQGKMNIILPYVLQRCKAHNVSRKARLHRLLKQRLSECIGAFKITFKREKSKGTRERKDSGGRASVRAKRSSLASPSSSAESSLGRFEAIKG